MSEFEYTKRLLAVTERNVELIERVHELEESVEKQAIQIHTLKAERIAAQSKLEARSSAQRAAARRGMGDYE